MIAATPVFIFTIIAFVGFLLLSVRLFLKYSKLSKHSRFDLYPIPIEGDGRGKYGGSYLEQDEWWTKERHFDRAEETKYLMNEMLLIKKLYQHQRSLWTPSFLFHAGIYIMFAWSIMLLIAAFWHPEAVVYIMFTVGGIGFLFSTLGAIMLLYRRVADPAFAVYTTPAEYFNLILILLTLTSGIYVWTSVASPIVVAYGMLTLSFESLPIVVVAHLILLGITLLYIPLSKMGHYAGKFFAFRSVQWDNEPNLPGNKVDRDVIAAAATPPTNHWSAPHTRPQTDQETEA